MAQITGNPAAGIGGMQLGIGANGPLVHLWGNGDPNAISDGSVVSAALGSLFTRLDSPDSSHFLYVKTAAPNTWTGK